MPLPWLDKYSRLRWPAYLILVALACIVTLAIAWSGPMVNSHAADPPPAPEYEESFVESIAPSPERSEEVLAPPPAESTCNCWREVFEEEPVYFLRGIGGASYFDTDSDTSMGAAYGLNFWLPIYGAFGAGARGSINHYEGGTQLGGSAGLYMNTMPGKFGWSVYIDQFTDTGLDDPYLVQGVYALKYGISDDLLVGTRYTDPIHGDDVDLLGTDGTPIRSSESIEAYLAYGPSVMNNVQVGVGYVDDIDSMTYRLGIAEPLTCRISANFDATYDEVGNWFGFLGFSVDLSPGGFGEGLLASRTRTSDLVRGAESSWFLGPSLGSIDASLEDSLYPDDDHTPDQDEGGGGGRKVNPKKGKKKGGCKCPPGYSLSTNGLCVNLSNPSQTVPCQ